MKRVLILETLVLAVLIFIFFFHKSNPDINAKQIIINNHELFVEIADSDASRTQGLSERTNLARDHGMLFIFPTTGYYKFWMKDMKFPLDFIWINKDTIVDLTPDVLSPKTPDESLPTFTSKFPFDKVIESNAGGIKSLNIKIGDRILL